MDLTDRPCCGRPRIDHTEEEKHLCDLIREQEEYLALLVSIRDGAHLGILAADAKMEIF